VNVWNRLDAFQQRHRWAGFPLAVVYKFAEDQGPYLAALITYYGFLALFPLLLLLASILGFVLQDDPELQQRVLDSTLSQFPVIGDQLGDPHGLQGSGAAIVTGAVVALYGALGVGHAVQNALNVAWAVPRHRRPNPLHLRFRGLLFLVIGAAAVIVTTVLSAVGGDPGAFGADVARSRSLLAVLIALAVNTAIFVVAFRVGTVQRTTFRNLLPGAVTASIVWQLLQVFGTVYVGNVVKGTGATYGAFALVLGLLAWLYLAAVGIVISAEINVVRAKRLYPRALLTPFTDNVDLTAADRSVYTDAATAQTAKGFQTISVHFDDDGQNASANGRRTRRP
jgi:YihY family inner membrane protein